MAKQPGDVGTSAVSTPVSGPNPMAPITKGSYGQDFNKDGRIGFGERIRDMFDGGGPAVSGGPFRGGGILSAIGNALTGNRGMGVGPEAGVGFAGYGYQGPNGWVSAAQDMRNGGGPGMAGPFFRGGGQYSGILNMLGVRPAGWTGVPTEMVGQGVKQMPMARNLAPTSSPVPSERPSVQPVASMAGLALRPQPAPNNVANMATNDFIGLDRFLAAQPTVPAIRGVNAPLVSGAPDLGALRLYTGGY